MKNGFNLNLQAVGENVRNLRKKACMSQEKLAEIMEISTATLSRIENGSKEMGIEHLKCLSVVFEMDMDTILEENSVKLPEYKK